MKLVILGKGGQGVLFFSRIIAKAMINKGLSVKATEIKGMAKRGGLVEVQMKIGEGKSPLIKRGGADLVVLLSNEFFDYARSFSNEIFTFEERDIKKAFSLVKGRYINTFLLGVFVKKSRMFKCEDFLSVLDEENKKSFLKGCEYGGENV